MRKFILFILLFPFLGLSQVQIGEDIDGESSFNQSGHTVSLSNDGSIVAIGAPDNSDNGSDSGQVRVFENISGVWTQIGEDIDGEAVDDISGFSVSLSSNGNIVAIGATGNDGNGDRSGHVRVFENISGNWVQIGQDIDGVAPDNRFGYSVSLSDNGSIIAIGADINSDNGIHSGHVRVFENISGNWIQIGQNIIGEAAGDRSGHSVSLSSNGNIVAIGAPVNNGNGTASGHVRVYENISGNWIQIGQDIDGKVSGDRSHEVSLSDNGNILAIGASYNNESRGHVRVFENISGNWVQIGQDINGESTPDNSGCSVSLNSDGTILAIGAFSHFINGSPAGHVRVFENISGNWVQIGQNIDSETANDNSGFFVSLSHDGSIVAIGAPWNDGNGDFSGHVRVYDLSAELSTEQRLVSTFKIYPNPTKNQFTIQLDDSSILEKVSVYNPLGQQVLTSKKMVVNTSNLASGSYIVEIKTSKGKASKKLIIE